MLKVIQRGNPLAFGFNRAKMESILAVVDKKYMEIYKKNILPEILEYTREKELLLKLYNILSERYSLVEIYREFFETYHFVGAFFWKVFPEIGKVDIQLDPLSDEYFIRKDLLKKMYTIDISMRSYNPLINRKLYKL